MRAFLLVLCVVGFARAGEVELLVQLMQSNDDDLRSGAGFRLKEIGAPAVAAVAALLKDPHPPIRQDAVYALGELGSLAKAHAHTLAEIMKKDREKVVRLFAFEALAKVDTRTALPLVLARLEDDDVVFAIEHLGPAATPDLLRLLHERGRIRIWAKLALEKFDPPPVRGIARLLQTGNVTVRLEAIALLSAWHEKSADVLPALAAACGDAHTDVAEAALDALRQMEEKAVPARKAAERAMRRTEAKVRAAAAWALGSMGDRAVQDSAVVLIAALRDRNATVRWASASALAYSGVEAAVPELRRLLRDPDVRVTAAAADAYWHVTDDAGLTVQALRPVLKAEDDYARTRAVRCLAMIGEAAKPAVPDLIAAAQREDDTWARIRIAGALFSAGAADAGWSILRTFYDDEDFAGDRSVTMILVHHATVPDLVRLLASDTKVTDPLASALSEREEPAARAVAELLQHERVDLRRIAAGVLRELEKEARPAVPALIRALDDLEPEVRETVIAALGTAGDRSPKVTGALEKVLRAGGDHRVDAAVALWRLGYLRERLLPVFAENLDEWPVDNLLLTALEEDKAFAAILVPWLERPRIRFGVAALLARAGVRRNLAEPVLREAARKGRLDLIDDLAWNELTPFAFDLLRLALRNESPDIRAKAVDRMAAGLTEYGLEEHVLMAEAAVQAWAPLLEDKSAVVREHTLKALEKMGPLAGPVVPQLIERLGTSDHIAALRVLAKIGRPARAAGPHLVRIVRDDKVADARMWAASALLSMGKEAPKGTSEVLFEAARKDPDKRVNFIAVQAIQRIAIERGNYAIGVGGGKKR